MSRMKRKGRVYSEDSIPAYMKCMLDRAYELKQVIDDKMDYDCYEQFKFKEFCYPESETEYSDYYVIYQRTDNLYSIALFSLDKNAEVGYTPHFVLDLSLNRLIVFDAYTLLSGDSSLSGAARDSLIYNYNAKVLKLIRDYIMLRKGRAD